MTLLNYTTKVDARKTISEIQEVLAKHGAKAVLTEYGDYGIVEAVSFKVMTPHGELSIRLPVDPDAVLKVLYRQERGAHVRVDRAQAVKVAWRILKDWIEAQMAIIETEMVRMEQVFLPYVVVAEDGRTLYERFIDSRQQLRSGEE